MPDDEDGSPGRGQAKAKDKKKAPHRTPAWESDYYNDEIVRIVADYLTLGSKALVSAPVRAASN